MTDRAAVPCGRSVLMGRRAAVALLLGGVIAVGCIPRLGRLPARELYRITLPDTGAGHAANAQQAPLNGTLAIIEYSTPGIYSAPGLVFRINETEYGAYPNREWALPLGGQLGALTERVLMRSPLTSERAVFDPPSRRAQTYLWRGTVREFDEVNRGRDVLAAVRIDARLVRALDDSILWSGTSRAEMPVASGEMRSIVSALGTLADSVVADLARRAQRDLAGTRAAVSPPPE